jgi:hypothetical protein
MRHLATICVFVTLLLPLSQSQAQRFGGGGPEGERPERLERFRKMRLVEFLKLGEDEAVRFFAKQSAHEDGIRELMKERNRLLDQLGDTTGAVMDAQALTKTIDSVVDTDKKIFAERERYQTEMRKFLKPAQFAKFLVFERDFGRQVRDAFQEMRREGRARPRGDD